MSSTPASNARTVARQAAVDFVAQGSARAWSPATGFRTLLYKEVLRFWKVSFQTVAAPVLTGVLYLLVFGHVLESHVDKQEGPVATVLILAGTLSTNDQVSVGSASGTVRKLSNYKGERVERAFRIGRRAQVTASAWTLFDGLRQIRKRLQHVVAV